MTIVEDKKLHWWLNFADFCQVLSSHYEKGRNVSSHEMICMFKGDLRPKEELLLKGCVHYIFTNLFCISKREHLWHKEKCFLFHFKALFIPETAKF